VTHATRTPNLHASSDARWAADTAPH
jgi:hypothetical protein